MSTKPRSTAVSVRTQASDLNKRLARWQVVQMPFKSSSLSERERQEVQKLVKASQYLEEIFWRQSDPEGLNLLESLGTSQDPNDRKLRRLLIINAGRFDLLDNNKPFVGAEPISPGRGFYPPGLERDQIEQYVREHPEKKPELYSPTTVVRRRGKDLQGIPYHVEYKESLEPAARLLHEAAALSDDASFARFLRLRAAALLNDDYYPSDLAWLDLKDPRIDVIFAPYETYLDDVLGVKGSYGAALLIRNEPESRRLALYQKYVPEIQDALPLKPQDRPSKRGQWFPMEVMDSPFRAGDLRHGYQAVADSLPNDPRVHLEKGTKKIFFKNFMEARVNRVILPLATRLMRPDQASRVSADGYLAAVILHEISHGLGPAYAHREGKQVDIREAIGPILSALEEAKADVVGMFGLKWLVDHNVLPRNRLEEYYDSYVGGIFRTVRYGTAEAHGKAEMMEFNFLTQEKAITRDEASGRYTVDYARITEALARLARQLLEMEARGEREIAEDWFKRYGTMPAELESALSAASELPVDIDPVFSFPDM